MYSSFFAPFLPQYFGLPPNISDKSMPLGGVYDLGNFAYRCV